MALLISRLKYPLAALEPFISERTMDCHYNWHYLTYISAANRLIEKTYYHDKDIRKIVSTAVGPIFNNAAQAFNHDFFFSCMIPNAPLIPSRLSEELKRQFRSTDTFLDAFLNSAVSTVTEAFSLQEEALLPFSARSWKVTVLPASPS